MDAKLNWERISTAAPAATHARTEPCASTIDVGKHVIQSVVRFAHLDIRRVVNPTRPAVALSQSDR
jgi:hypothetical protein